MSKLISNFVSKPRTYRELYEATDTLLGYTGLKSSNPKIDGKKWWEVWEYLDFHANGTKPSPPVEKHKKGKSMSKFKPAEQQLREAIQDIVWNVYREEDEAKEGGAVNYRMNRVMETIKEFKLPLDLKKFY